MNDANLRMPLTIHLKGPAVARHRLQLDQLTLFAEQLQVAVHRIGRILSGESFSLTRGPIPKEVRDACTLELVAIEPGSLSLTCDLPLRSDSSGSQQLTLFQGNGEIRCLGERALEAFVHGIESVGNSDARLPEGFDKGVLLALREGGKLFSLGVEQIDFELYAKKTQRITSQFTPAIQNRIIARIQDPVINKASIEGRLLMGDFRDAAYACRIHPHVGKAIRCTFDEEQKEAVLAAMTRYVKLVGESVEVNNEIRSFKIQDIEILDTEQFGGGQNFHPFFDNQIELDALAEEQGVAAAANFDNLLGDFWPEEESADEFTNAVRNWRQEDLPNAS